MSIKEKKELPPPACKDPRFAALPTHEREEPSKLPLLTTPWTVSCFVVSNKLLFSFCHVFEP